MSSPYREPVPPPERREWIVAWGTGCAPYLYVAAAPLPDGRRSWCWSVREALKMSRAEAERLARDTGAFAMEAP